MMSSNAHASQPDPALSLDDPQQLDAEGWNLTRFDPEKLDPKKGHLESTFIKLNDPKGGRALWVKLTIFAPTEKTSGGPPHQRGRTVAEAWAIAFDRTQEESAPASYRNVETRTYTRDESSAPRHVAVKQTVPVEEAELARVRPFALRVANVRYDGKRLQGHVEHGNARVAFDVTLTPRDLSPLAPLPFASMYRGPFPKTKLVSPIVDALAEGEVVVESASGRRTWDVKGWPAMQGHNWGTGHADTYAWAHCNAWHEPEGRDVVLEGFSGKVRVGPVLTPMITIIAVRHRGVRYEAKATSELLRARGSIEALRRWSFSAKQAGATMVGSISLREDDTVGLYYPNPTGEMTYCLNSKIARATLRFEAHDRPPLLLTSDAAALEIGTHDASHGIRMYV